VLIAVEFGANLKGRSETDFAEIGSTLRHEPDLLQLQWGREHVLAEIAHLISYSIFKDHGRLRERHIINYHFPARSSSTDHDNSRPSNPLTLHERSTPSRHRAASRAITIIAT
jgi:hypothetical protein